MVLPKYLLLRLWAYPAFLFNCTSGQSYWHSHFYNGLGGAGNDLSAVVKTAAAVTGGGRDSAVESFVASITRKEGKIEASGKARGTSANM